MSVTPLPGVGRGVLHRAHGLTKFRIARFSPSADMAPFVEHYWTVGWDLRGEPPFVQYTLPDPTVTLAVEPGRSELVFVMTGRFRRELVGAGRVFAVKFLPGGFWPFTGVPQSQHVDRREPVGAHLDVDGAALEHALLGEARLDPTGMALAGLADADLATMAQTLEATLRALARRDDPQLALAQAAVATVHTDPALMNVATLAAQTGLPVRRLQRLFDKFIGLSPKWLIQRVRLQEAAERLASVSPPGGGLADLAADLGFSDQAHMTRAFKTLTGETPAAYAAGQRARARER